MRRFLTLIIALVSLFACTTSHYEDVVRIAASKHPRACDAPYKVVQLARWGYRVDACEGTLFYRCSAQRKMGHMQCCRLVDDEASATAVLSASAMSGEGSTCVEFAD